MRSVIYGHFDIISPFNLKLLDTSFQFFTVGFRRVLVWGPTWYLKFSPPDTHEWFLKGANHVCHDLIKYIQRHNNLHN